MINLVKGDLRRIIKKKGFWIALICILAFVVLLAITQRFVSWNGYAYIYTVQQQVTLYTLILSTLIFLGVYGDEFRAMAMTCAIGRGVSRNRLIISKLIDNIILSVILFGIFAIEAVIAGLIMGAGMTSEETFALVLYIMIGAVKSVGYTSIASIILFVNANIPIGVFVLLVLHMIMPIVINTASSSSKLLSSLHLDRWFFGGMVESGYSSIVLGMTAGGIMTLVLGCVIYIGISVGVTIALFSKREMDF